MPLFGLVREINGKEKEAVEILQRKGILNRTRICANKHEMILHLSDKSDRWKCNKKDRRTYYGLRKGTWVKKTTTLNIFEGLIFNYKIKVNSVDQVSPQFISFVVELCNELQLVLPENVTGQSDKPETVSVSGTIFCELQTDNAGFEAVQFDNSSLPSVSEEVHKEVWGEKDEQENVVTQEANNLDGASTPCSPDRLVTIYSCELCKRKYRTKEKLLKHLCKSAAVVDEKYEESIDNPDPVDAELCETSSPLEQGRELPVCVCAGCFSAFRSKELFLEHNHADTTQELELMSDSIQLRSHRKFTCSVCCEVYRSLARISYHVARCHAGPYQCELCPHVAASKQLLNHHKKKNHKGVESFFCAECGLGFKLRTSLQKHMVNRHEKEQENYRCQDEGCGQVFTKKIKLTNHRISVHGMERKFLCQVCGNKFMTQDSLSSHLDSHTNSWKFQCQFCKKVFNTKEKMTFHVRTHTGERPFACDRTNCQKSFVSKSKLMEHLQRHRGEKPHKCTICGKQYANKPDLRTHLKKLHPTDETSSQVVEIAAPVTEQQPMELYPSQVILQVENTVPDANNLFSNVDYYQDPVHVVRTVTLPVITSYDSIIRM